MFLSKHLSVCVVYHFVFRFPNELQCYEGMKAYVDAHGGVRLFRPEKNMERFNKSAARLCLPSFADNELLECIKKLVEVDKDWYVTSPPCLCAWHTRNKEINSACVLHVL